MSLSEFSLEGKIAFVTGGGRGLGRAGAVAFARAGADIVLVSRTRHQLEETAAAIEALGRRALVAHRRHPEARGGRGGGAGRDRGLRPDRYPLQQCRDQRPEIGRGDDR